MEALIPGIPDDIAEECLMRVAYDHLFTLHSVCRRWSEHVRPPYFNHRRRLAGITRCLFVIIQRPLKFNPKSYTYEPDFSLTLFDPILATSRSLPPIPGLLNLLRGPSGIHEYHLKSIMRYDMEEDSWETVTDIAEGNGFFYTGGVFHFGKFYLFKRPNDKQERSQGKYSCDVYDLASREWCPVELIESMKKIYLYDRYAHKYDEFAFSPDGRIYCCRKGRYLLVKEGEIWWELADLPDDPPHSLFLCCWRGGVSAIRLKLGQFLYNGMPSSIPAYNVYTMVLQGKQENLQWTRRNVLPQRD